MMFGGLMGSRVSCAKDRASTALATGAAMAAAAITCGGFAVELGASGPASWRASSAGTRFAPTSTAHLSIWIDAADVASTAPGGAVSYLIRVLPPKALVRGVTIAAAASPAGVTVTTSCAGRSGQAAAKSAQGPQAGAPGQAGSGTAAPAEGTLARSVLDALTKTVPAAGDRAQPAITTCTLGPAAAMDAATGLLVTVRIPDRIAVGRLAQLVVGAARPAGTDASGTAGEPACAADTAGTCDGTATATVTIPVVGPVSPARPVPGPTRPTPEPGGEPAAGPDTEPSGPTTGPTTEATQRRRPTTETQQAHRGG